MKHLMDAADEAGMEVGLTYATQGRRELYLTWRGKQERINEICIRDYGGSLEAGAHILSDWIKNRPKREFA